MATGHRPYRIPRWLGGLGVIVAALVAGADDAPAPRPTDEPSSTFTMTPAVVCAKVEGLDRYTPQPDATLTNLDKLKVYFRPLRFKVETDPTKKQPYRARFTQDGRVRRKGEKTPLAKEDKLLEFDTRFDVPDYQIYLVDTIGLDKFPPGEYEFDIILHDEIDGRAIARQTVPFRIVPVANGEQLNPASASEPKKPASGKKTEPNRSTKRSGSSG